MRPAVPKLVVLTIGLVALASGVAFGQTAAELTADELVARALRDNPGLKAARLDVDAAAARVQEAGLRPNPMLEIGGQKAISPDNNLNIGLSLPLDLNGRKEGRVGVAERELDSKRRQVSDRERRLRADVRMKAGEVLAARRGLGVVDELLQTNRDGLAVVGNRVREGAAPSLDESLQLVEVNRLDAGRQLAHSRVEIATLQLKALTGRPADALLIINGELAPAPLPPDQTEALRRSISDRPDVAVARAEVAVASAMVKKEQADGRWDASISVGYQRQDTGFPLNGLTASGQTRPIQDVFHYFGGAVSITLPVRNGNEGNIA